MNLKSTTDFVLEQEKNYAHVTRDLKKNPFLLIVDYAKFLKQPLTLGMFVPCDENGSVLKEPKNWKAYLLDACRCEKCIEKTLECDEYKKAQEKVLFKGFYVEFNSVMSPQGGYLDVGNLKNKTIETIVGAELELTESAIKQIGI